MTRLDLVEFAAELQGDPGAQDEADDEHAGDRGDQMVRVGDHQAGQPTLEPDRGEQRDSDQIDHAKAKGEQIAVERRIIGAQRGKPAGWLRAKRVDGPGLSGYSGGLLDLGVDPGRGSSGGFEGRGRDTGHRGHTLLWGWVKEGGS